MALRKKKPAAPTAEDLPKFPDVGKHQATNDDVRSLARGDRESGAVARPRTLTKDIVDQAKAAALAQRDVPRVKQPHWAKRLVAAKSSPEEMLKAAVERASKSPNEATLREVEAVVNELGRDAKRVTNFGQLVTPDVIRTVMKKKQR